MSALEPVTIKNLRIARSLYDLVQSEIAPGTGLDPDTVWTSFGAIVENLGPENRRLLEVRARHEQEIDAWHEEQIREHPGEALDPRAYKAFLIETGYLLPEDDPLTITTSDVDPEISSIAGPQLVVPVDNARYALNAANARWGSLYDALYGTDVIGEEDGAERGTEYNPVRGSRVVEWAERFLDDVVPLEEGLYSEVTEFLLEADDGASPDDSPSRLVCVLADGRRTGLADPSYFAGFQLEDGRVSSVLLRHHDLYIDLRIDRNHAVGKVHPAGVCDVVIESAVTTIQDCEDSVSAVDAEDKVLVYRNWLGIMKGTLTATLEKGGRTLTRTLNEDRTYQDPSGEELTLPGRSLLLVRNVGIHMYTDAVTTTDGEPIPEGFLDVLITAWGALHDLRGNGAAVRNSRAGSMYIVKPKLHGPEEVLATVELFAHVEQALGLRQRTLKIGIMDEERRTTVNLKECIRAAADRVIFINTGFLDRTGDEIHTSMVAGAMIPKPEIKSCPWMLAYEDWNVDVGIECGLPGVAQIGKGMWAAPEILGAMMDAKIDHPRAGANTAWVPSPTAATLHATHYHRVNVREVQSELAGRGRADLDAILTLPLLGDRGLADEEIQNELENNTQGILGYVVRWVGQGIGCSKVPDINDVALMEDRATLRISSQHIANWLHHGLITADQVTSTFEAMAAVVDSQNEGDPDYTPMSPDLSSSPEFQAALELVFAGRRETNGYTETVLHARRREVKARTHATQEAGAS
ncbi:MAG: malate synthase G [Gemmatimonadetes bacterium]|nr:malate synthase G [Gemmatimonadota bacterium]